MTINQNFRRDKDLRKKEINTEPEDGDKKTEGGIEFIRKNDKWVKVVNKSAKYKVAKAKKTPGKMIDRSRNQVA